MKSDSLNLDSREAYHIIILKKKLSNALGLFSLLYTDIFLPWGKRPRKMCKNLFYFYCRAGLKFKCWLEIEAPPRLLIDDGVV